MKKLFLPLAALLFWILFLGQKAANRPVGPALDSLLIGKKPEASLEMLRAFCDQDRAEKDWPSFQKHVHKMGKILEQQRDFEQIDRLAAEAVRDLEKASAHDSLIAKTIIWRGYAQRSMENWTISLDHYRLAVRLFERAGFRGPSYSAALTGAAQILVRFADYSQANEFFQKGIALESSQRLLTQTANNYFWQDSLEKAFLFIQKATKCPSDGPKLDAHMGQVAGAIFFKKGDMRLARGFYEKALAIFGSLQNENPNKLRCLTGLAEIERKIQNPKKAVRLYAEAEALGRLFFKGRSREMAKLFVEQGDFFLENRQPDAAILAFQKAMTEAWPTFSSLQISENPSLENAPTEQYAMHAAARKARFLLKNEPVSSENRQNAARCFDLAFAVGEKLRAAYGRDEAKLYLQQNNYDLRRAAARNRFEIAKTATTEAEKTAELARLFNLLESGRAAVLRDALQAQKAIERLEMPDSLRKKEADFRRERALTEINLAAVSAAADSAAVANLQGRLFEIGQKQAAFLADLEKKSPDFARLRRTSETLGAFEIQKKLADSVAVLSWLDAGDRWFCAVLRRNKIDCFEAPKTPATENQLLDFERFLLDRAAQQAAPDSFFQAVLPSRRIF